MHLRQNVPFLFYYPTVLFHNSCRLCVHPSVLEAGKYWPFNHDFDEQAFRDYFLSDACFVMRAKENKMNIKESQLLAMFYVKPNFPGRCDHICNGGFITAREVCDPNVSQGPNVAPFMRTQAIVINVHYVY